MWLLCVCREFSSPWAKLVWSSLLTDMYLHCLPFINVMCVLCAWVFVFAVVRKTANKKSVHHPTQEGKVHVVLFLFSVDTNDVQKQT